MLNNQKPVFCSTPAAAAGAYKEANKNIQGIDQVALIRTTSAKTGKKIWAVVSEGEGVNCSFDAVACADDWWDNSYDQDTEV